MGCGRKIILRKDMSYGWICFSGVHIFRMTCLMRAIVLKEVMLCRKKCLVSGHEDTLDEERFYWRVCFIRNHVLHDGMSYRQIYVAVVYRV